MKHDITSHLVCVQHPVRYLGNELHSVHKDPTGKLRVGLALPDTYEIGMSSVGLRILYGLLNAEDDVWCERVFTPWVDYEALLRQRGWPLTTLESRTPIRELDVLGISIAYEMLGTNVLNLLDLGGIPLRAEERREEDPIVLVGGACAVNPEPFAPFADLFFVGEAETELAALLRLAARTRGSRSERLAAMAERPGVYDPRKVELRYGESGRIERLLYDGEAAAGQVRRVLVEDLDGAPFPTSTILPYMDVVHDRANLELHRGCVHGCRFCQAGAAYRPCRPRSLETLRRQSREILRATGWEEIGLSSLNSVDHPGIRPLIDGLNDEFAAEHVAVGLPSLRLDSLSVDLAKAVGGVRRTQVTLAPEAGSQRMRDRINKGLTQEQILASIEAFAREGWRDFKLYFMIGLPFETDDDVAAIGELVESIGRHCQRSCRKRPFLKLSVSSFVPKAHTPFQWAAGPSLETLKRRIRVLKESLPPKGARVSWREFELGQLEGLFARGDRRLAEVIHDAWKAGAKLDAWTEHFDFGRWQKALAGRGIDLEGELCRERDADEILPWDAVSCGVSRDFLRAEWERAARGETTPHCGREGCQACGLDEVCARIGRPMDAPSQEEDGTTERAPSTDGTGEPAAEAATRTESADEMAPPDPPGGDERPIRYALCYGKEEELRFLSHLELATAMKRCFARARLPMRFSEGFNPKPRLSYGPPLAVGAAGDREWMELHLLHPVAPAATLEALTATAPPGLRFHEFVRVADGGDVPAKAITAARWTLRAAEPFDWDWAAMAADLLERESVEVRRVTPKKVKIKELRPGIFALEALEEGGWTATLACDNQLNVSPADLLAALRPDEPAHAFFGFEIIRRELLEGDAGDLRPFTPESWPGRTKRPERARVRGDRR